jgi:desulfoferrodoxin-like iron-binding protein
MTSRNEVYKCDVCGNIVAVCTAGRVSWYAVASP